MSERRHGVRHKAKRRQGLSRSADSGRTGERSADRESLYGIYCHCRRNPEETVTSGLEDFVELVEETTYNLTETERRRFLKLADGRRPDVIAAEEGCKREAVLGSIRAMAIKNDYCAIATEHGCLRPKKNQYAYADSVKRGNALATRKCAAGGPSLAGDIPQSDHVDTRDLYPEDVLADDGCPNFPLTTAPEEQASR